MRSVRTTARLGKEPLQGEQGGAAGHRGSGKSHCRAGPHEPAAAQQLEPLRSGTSGHSAASSECHPSRKASQAPGESWGRQNPVQSCEVLRATDHSPNFAGNTARPPRGSRQPTRPPPSQARSSKPGSSGRTRAAAELHSPDAHSPGPAASHQEAAVGLSLRWDVGKSHFFASYISVTVFKNIHEF